MSDISTIWSPSLGLGDWYVPPVVANLIIDEDGESIIDELGAAINDGLFAGGGDLRIGNDLGTAVLISLFTDGNASADDLLPDQSGDRRGWWGDLGADRPIGSKLWLRFRSKQTDVTLALVKNDIEQALRWLIDDGIAASIDVTTEWTRQGVLGCQIAIIRQTGPTAAVQFSWAWKDFD